LNACSEREVEGTRNFNEQQTLSNEWGRFLGPDGKDSGREVVRIAHPLGEQFNVEGLVLASRIVFPLVRAEQKGFDAGFR
jgi:hypothetical protein